MEEYKIKVSQQDEVSEGISNVLLSLNTVFIQFNNGRVQKVEIIRALSHRHEYFAVTFLDKQVKHQGHQWYNTHSYYGTLIESHIR